MPIEGARQMSDCVKQPKPVVGWGGVRWGLALAGVLSAASAIAGEDSTPLFLTASQSLMRDSNFSRTENPQAETVSSTALTAGLNKDYGRQNYRLSGQLAANRYANYKELLNNESKSLSGGFRTDFLSNWQLNLGGAYSRNLNPIKDNASVDRVVKNIRTYRDGYASVRYGLDGLWSIQANADRNNVGYSRPSYSSAQAKQRSGGLQATYYPSDLLSFTLGRRDVSTFYPNGAPERTTNDRNIDLSTNWVVSGLSSFGATVTKRHGTTSDDPLKRTSGWSGNLDWRFTPRGLISYNLGWSRYTGADRKQDNNFYDPTSPQTDLSGVSQRIDTVNTSTNYRAGLGAQLTGKTSLSYTYAISKNRYALNSIYSGVTDALQGYQFNSTQQDKGSIVHTSTVSLNYNPMRSLSTQCSLQVYSQTRDQNNVRFQGKEVDCTLSFTLE
jgi:hypothetical protein